MTGKTRLIFVRQSYTPFGGAERFLARTLETLRAQGTPVEILCRKWKAAEGPIPHTLLNPFHLGRRQRDAGFARAVCRHVEQHPETLVQSHERLACCDIYRAGDGLHREWLIQRRRASTAAGRLAAQLSPYHRYVLKAESEMFASPRLKRVICNSAMVMKEIGQHYPAAVDKCALIPNGVDSQSFHPALANEHRPSIRKRWGIPESALVYLMVGSGYERKGVPTLLQATAQLPADCHVLIVGKSRRPGRYEKTAQSLGIAERVHFAGPQPDPRPYYGAADAFVLPALYDPAPNAVLEAMACALPVVVSHKTGTLTSDGPFNLACDALDSEALAGAMGRLRDASLRKELGANARSLAEQSTFENMAMTYNALYRELFSHPPA